MSVKDIVLLLVVVVNSFFAYVLVKDLLRNRDTIMSEPAPTAVLPFSSALIFFFSTLGISDFAISTFD